MNDENKNLTIDPESTQTIDQTDIRTLQRRERKTGALTDWAKEPTVADLNKDLTAATPFHNTQSNRIKGWAVLHKGGKPIPKRRNRSQVRSKLIRRQAEWRYSALSEPFLSSDKVFTVKPRTFEDTDAARQNELLLNWQFDTKLNKVKLMDELVHTAVDEGTAIVRVGWDRSTTLEDEVVPVYQYIAVTEEMPEFGSLQQALQLKIENPRGFLELDDALQKSAEYTLENKVPAWATKVGDKAIKVEKVLDNKPTIEVMDYDNVYLDPSCKGVYEDARFIIASYETSKAELIKEGRYKGLKDVNWKGASILGEPDHVSTTPDSFNFSDDLRKRVVAYEYWGYYDITGKEVLEPIVATWIGNQMIRMERNPFPDKNLPFVFINYLPVKRSAYGEPDAELLEDNQTISGAVTRGAIDLMGRSANSQQGIAKGVLDVTNKRRFEAGDDYEYNPNQSIEASIFQHKFPELPQSVFSMLNMQNQDAESLSGVKSFSGGLSGEAYGKVAAGIRGALDASAKREMNILRRFARGVQEIGNKIIAMNSEFLSDAEVVRITNKEYVTIRKEDIQGNFDMIVDISTPEVDEKKAQDLGFMLQTLGPQSSPEFINLILSEIARLRRMPELANRIENYKPEPDPIQEKKQELELMELEYKIQKIASEIKLNEARSEKALADAESVEVDTDQNLSGVTHDRKMEAHTEQARGNQDLEITKALTKSVKEGETGPSIEEAVGFNELSKELANASKQPASFNGFGAGPNGSVLEEEAPFPAL